MKIIMILVIILLSVGLIVKGIKKEDTEDGNTNRRIKKSFGNPFVDIILGILVIFILMFMWNPPQVKTPDIVFLNANNYTTYPADFNFGSFLFKVRDTDTPKGEGLTIFSLMASQFGSALNYDALCQNDLDDLRCVLFSYEEIGNRKPTEDKYLHKVAKTPLHVASFSNGSEGDIYLSDSGAVNSSYSIRCHLTDPQNIKKYLSEAKKVHTINVIGEIDKIATYDAAIKLDPCYYIDIHQQ